MHQKLTRLAFARLAVAAPLVALALRSDGSRDASAITFCKRVANACASGCNSTCYGFCNNGFGTGCPACSVCTDPEPEPSDPCAFVNSTCSQIPTCGLSCGLACTGSTCAVCQTCFPED